MFTPQWVMAAEREMIMTYWLMPAEPARKYFASLISDLANRFDAPAFEPHLTVYVTKMENVRPDELLKRVLAGCGAYRLSIGGVDYSDEFTKTLFVQFQPNEELSRLSASFRRAAGSRNEYQLNPHLSLIYKTMSRERKEEIASSLSLPFDKVLFDSAKAVISPVHIKSRKEVEAWRVVAEQKLTE
jgi:2'-5' RNA ligase